MASKNVIVVTRNGRTTVIEGWRAWLLGIAAMLLAWLVLGFVVFALIGAAITVGLVLLLLVPAAIVAILLASFVGRR